MSTERSLPLRVPILAGECLDSWLEAVARRHHITLPQLMRALGFPVPHRVLAGGIAAGDLRQIERQTGLPEGRLDHAVLDPFSTTGWARRPGSRYCPFCLAENGGRWMLAWRLTWVFACVRHGVLLADHCPGCQRRPRDRAIAVSGTEAMTRCPVLVDPARRCGTDLAVVAATALTSPILTGADDDLTTRRPGLVETQRRIDTLLTAHAADAATTSAIMSDLPILASWLLSHLPETELDQYGEHISGAWRRYQAAKAAHHLGPNPFAAVTSAVAAPAVCQALTLITDDNAAAITRWRRLPQPHYNNRDVRPPDMSAAGWRQLSAPTRTQFLRAADPYLNNTNRIRYRSCTSVAREPEPDTTPLQQRARHIPQQLWPEWIIRLVPVAGFQADSVGATIALCLLIPGHPDHGIKHLITDLHGHRTTMTTSSVLVSLVSQGHHSILAAICHLADYLDTHGSPIDYQRRRHRIKPDRLITDSGWCELCYRTDAHPGGSRRLLDARRYLFQLLTGADLNDLAHALAFHDAADRAVHLDFAAGLTTPLRAALHDHAEALLRRMRINEPLTWHPPATCCTGLDLPGTDPEAIDTDALHQIVVIDRQPLSVAAERLDTTIDHIRLAMQNTHRPARRWGPNAPPAARDRRQRAEQLLTRHFFEHHYIQGGKNLSQLEEETGFHRKILGEYAKKAGLTLTSAFQPAPIDEAWLREQYLTRRRSIRDIARELGHQDITVTRAARRYAIPIRPAGTVSHPDMIAELPDDIPQDVRSAIKGTLHGRERLRRFQTAMAFPTLAAAADHLGIFKSALTSQLQRLEADIGAQLFHRAARGRGTRSLRPTERGTALLRALNLPAVHAVLSENDLRGQAPPRNQTNKIK